MDILFELFEDMPRQGPGTNQSTKRAFSLLQDLPAHPEILDIGCGSGKQTLALAESSHGDITAVDVHAPFLAALNESARQRGLETQIRTVEASMFDLPFDNASFDVLWSEGAIYIMGFEEGIHTWHRLLRDGGYLVVSEITWLKKHPPKDAVEFWQNAYPGMSTIEDNVERAKSQGYTLRGIFTLPEEGWWEEFYTHLKGRLALLQEKYASDAETLATLEAEAKEINYYEKYSEWYGYVFYILKKEPA